MIVHARDYECFPIGISSKDVAYNARRGILAALPPLKGNVSCHLFTIGPDSKREGHVAKFLRKSKRCSQFEKIHSN